MAPLFSLLLTYNRTGALQCFSKLYEPLGRIGAAIQQHVLNQHFQLRFNLLVHFEHPGIHDAHVHSRRNCVIEKRGVHSFANFVVAPEAE